MSIGESIVRYIKEMSEEEAKKMLAKVLLKHEKIGRNNYSKEDFLNEVNQISFEIVAGDILK